MVKAHAGILETDSAQVATDKLDLSVRTALADDGDADWVVRRLQPLVGLGSDQELSEDQRSESFAAWRRFFEALADRSPLVLVFEDLQWADEGLLDFIDYLVEWVSDLPVFVVATARPELLERRPAWGGGKVNAATVQLQALSEDDTARLVSALLEQAVLPAETQAVLLARAGGNPLYAQEFIRMLVDRRYLRRDGSAWRLDAGRITAAARVGPGSDRRAPRRLAAGGEGAPPGRVRPRQGHLGGRTGRNLEAAAPGRRGTAARPSPQGVHPRRAALVGRG